MAHDVECGSIEPPTTTTAGSKRFRWDIPRESALVVAVVAALLVPLIGLVGRNLDLPLTYHSDANFSGMVVKGLIEHGSILRNPSMGAPFGQQLYDVPQGADNLQYLLLRAIGTVTGNWALTINLYFISGFFLAALSAYWVLRCLRFSLALSLAAATLFAFLPYHFTRGTLHLLLSAYWMVPPAVLLLVWSLDERDDVADPDDEHAHRWHHTFGSRRLVVAILLAALIGSSSTYYAAFAAILLTAVAVLLVFVRRDPRALVPGALLAGVIAAAMVLNNLPSVVFWAQHGFGGVKRNLAGTEVYGLRIVALLLPTAGHRINLFARITAHAQRGAGVPSEPGGALGVIGVLGFVGLLFEILRSTIGGHPPESDRKALRSALGLLLACALLLSLIGGFGFVLGLAGLTWIRGWNRISVFIAFFAFIYVATWAEEWTRRLTRRGVPAAWVLAGLAAITLVGVLDQTPKQPLAPQQPIAVEYQSDQRFVAQIESTLPRNAAVFQLPIISFPEHAPVIRMIDYDLAKGYLHSRRLRWSYGAMRGREGKWLDRLATKPVRDVVPAVTAAGFDGLYIDRYGYKDDAHSLEATLEDLLGEKPIVSDNGRLSFFDLRTYAETLHHELGDAALAQLKADTLRQ